MEIQKINEFNREEYWKFISNDPVTYFFEMRDFMLNFETSDFWMSKENGMITGSMYCNEAKSMRLYGNQDTIVNFIKNMHDIPKYMNFPEGSNKIISMLVKNQKKRLDMIRLFMRKSEFHGKSTHICFKIKKGEMEEVLDVLKAAEPGDWMQSTVDDLSVDEENIWYGIRQDARIVSVCWVQMYSHGGHVAFIATHPDYQNHGLASSILNYSLLHTFMEHELSIIHVRENNANALHCYLKVGYKEKLRYTVLIDPEMK